jgi:hypothetical protein
VSDLLFPTVRPDHGGTPDDRKLTGLDDFGPSDQVFDWMADRLADGPTRLVVWGSTIPRRCRHRVGTVKSVIE